MPGYFTPYTIGVRVYLVIILNDSCCLINEAKGGEVL